MPLQPKLCRTRSRRRVVMPASATFYPPVAAPVAGSTCSAPLVLRVPPCGSAITCVRVGSCSAVLGVGRDLRVFSIASGRQLGTVSRAAGGVIGCVDVCDDVGLLVCGSRDCTLRWFDFDSFACQRVSARRSQHSDSVSAVRLVPGTSGRKVVSSGLDGKVKLWDTETGQSLSSSSDSSGSARGASGSAGLLLSLDLVHPSGGTYVTGATCAGEGNVGEGRVALWDVRTRDGLVSQVTAPCGLIPSVSFCSYNSGIAAGGSDGVVRVYDMRFFKAEALHEVSVPPTPVSAFASAPPASSYYSSSVVDVTLAPDSLSLVPPSTSPPSPSILGSPMSSSPPSRRHIQSVCLLPDRLLALQSTALTIFASSPAPPRKSSAFPFAHPVHSITLRQMTHAASSSSATSSLSTAQRLASAQQQPSYSSPAADAATGSNAGGRGGRAAGTQHHTLPHTVGSQPDTAARGHAGRRDERGAGSSTHE